jgi:NADH-quinone oxidoreductase subunit M
MFGPVTNPANEHLPDLNMREYATLIPLVLLAFWIGIYPKPLFRVLDAPVRQIVEQVNPNYYNSATAQRWGEKPPVVIVTATAPAKSDSAKPEKPVKPAVTAVIAAASAPPTANTAANR